MANRSFHLVYKYACIYVCKSIYVGKFVEMLHVECGRKSNEWKLNYEPGSLSLLYYGEIYSLFCSNWFLCTCCCVTFIVNVAILPLSKIIVAQNVWAPTLIRFVHHCCHSACISERVFQCNWITIRVTHHYFRIAFEFHA